MAGARSNRSLKSSTDLSLAYQNHLMIPSKQVKSPLKSVEMMVWNHFRKKKKTDHHTYPLFRNKRFALNEMFQRNASKFAIFYV